MKLLSIVKGDEITSAEVFLRYETADETISRVNHKDMCQAPESSFPVNC